MNNEQKQPMSLTGRSIVSALAVFAIGTIGGGIMAAVLNNLTQQSSDDIVRALPSLVFIVIAGISIFVAIGFLDRAQAEERYAQRLKSEGEYEKDAPQPAQLQPPLQWQPVPELQAPKPPDLTSLTTEMIESPDGRGGFSVPLWKLQKLIAIYPETSRTACNSANILTGDYGTDHQRLIGAGIFYGWLKKEVPNGKTGQGREAGWVVSPMEARRQFNAIVMEAAMRTQHAVANIQAPHSPK